MPKPRIDGFLDKPITVYNADKQEVVGIFTTLTLVCKYFRPDQPQKAYSNFFDALKRKNHIRKSRFDFKLALRHATQQQIIELGERPVVILNGYPEIEFNKLKGYDSTRSDLYSRMLLSGFKKDTK